ncbi:MAG: response regulator [Deltaproteobacteria bacterium]|nr:response regulator [Deltaproteobacteria bacterium]
MGAKRCDVFIVEDDFDIREVLTEVLQDEGFTVSGAANGKDALLALGNGVPKPKLILLDLMMPVMSGWQFVAEPRKEPALADIPVVVVSADGNLQQKAESLGASGCLRKPIEIDMLLSLVKRYCR